ncbi:MAG: LLM class flavin-dependent oxidoreductase [Novosphingobium sp.]|nr:LLM class flavin-dependent oxidoreductase [Novosphingobium sp.]MCP5404350.1 LLM class flavin-dependent oxidoreductase [Novosphingobium sp.]
MSVRIGMGPGLGAQLSPGEYWRWIDHCEESGVDSLWHSDQLLGSTLEPVTMLAALAARTSRMRFGTNALVLPFRDPVVIAKEFATVDLVGGGRLLPVFGVGAASDPYWNATGVSSKGRGGRANEAIELVRLLLDCEQVEFEGSHYRYHGPGMHPRPARSIPLWIGGNSPAALRRTAALGDGWLGSLMGPARAGAARRGIEAALAETGRTIDSDHYGVTLFMRIGSADDPQVEGARQGLLSRMKQMDRSVGDDAFAVGPPEEIVALIRNFVSEGMSKFVALPMASDFGDLMEQTSLLVREVLPAVED